MRNGWFTDSGGARRAQSMHSADGTFKGMEAILRERGVDVSRLRTKCGKAQHEGLGCKAGAKCCMKNVRPLPYWLLSAQAGRQQPTDRGGPRLHQVLNGQPDFAQQRTALEELMELAGDMAIMLPKMHPELNPIESFWAAMKAYCRSSLPMEAAACARMQPQPSMPL